MNLAVDFGNTRVKVALFNGNDLVNQQNFTNDEVLLQALPSFGKIDRCIVASVTRKHEAVLDYCTGRYDTVLFKATTPTPLVNKYRSALTLGSDRLAAAVGSYTLFPNRDVLTIDAGTCIKYNFVNADNAYIGGAISPGLPMRLKAMHQFTDALPAVDFDTNFEKLTGQSSVESILAGGLVGAACEVDGMIDRYLGLYPNLQVVMTGGDAPYLCKQLKNRFFANHTILLMGLNRILNYQLEK